MVVTITNVPGFQTGNRIPIPSCRYWIIPRPNCDQTRILFYKSLHERRPRTSLADLFGRGGQDGVLSELRPLVIENGRVVLELEHRRKVARVGVDGTISTIVQYSNLQTWSSRLLMITPCIITNGLRTSG